MATVAYICDFKDPRCKDRCSGPSFGICFHTTDPDHAVNGSCPDPENHPERFEYFRNGDIYFEKEEGR